jgi:methyl-accepting chemotaxis protein
VVADEVRNLAMRAAEAAKKIAELIEGNLSNIKNGSELVASTDHAFSGVAESAAKVGDLVGEIAAASSEQAQGLEQINKATSEMDKVTRQVAANAEESAAAAEELSAQAETMKGMVGELENMVGGARAGQAKAALKPVSTTKQLASPPWDDSSRARGEKGRSGNQPAGSSNPMEEEDFADF